MDFLTVALTRALMSISLSRAFFQAEKDAEEAAEVAKIREAENEKPVESGGEAVLN
jgi:hypothetical protein